MSKSTVMPWYELTITIPCFFMGWVLGRGHLGWDWSRLSEWGLMFFALGLVWEHQKRGEETKAENFRRAVRKRFDLSDEELTHYLEFAAHRLSDVFWG